jgi:isoamylase
VLGARPIDGGVNFAIFSAHAEAVELCLFDADGVEEVQRLPLPGSVRDVWHGFLPGAGPGLHYGYRVHGPYAPHLGHRFNPNKLLLDPYARMLHGSLREDPCLYGYRDPDSDGEPDPRDSAACMPRAVVMAPLSAVARGPITPWAETCLYEMHLKGFTQRHPAVPEVERGTVAGLACDAVVDYLKALGVTAIELLPVHAFTSEAFLIERGLGNYWGYNTLGWFAPHTPYVGDGGAAAFQAMVRRLHDAGLEVILDVVYNHSCEGNERGPTLSLRGIDNASYYRLVHGKPQHYVNDTGCGNTLDMEQPIVRRMVLDSLRYWAGTLGVDGFRFDLGTTLGRSAHGFDPHSALLRQISEDPLLSQCKLIAEPWDVGPGGYRLGADFPPPGASGMIASATACGASGAVTTARRRNWRHGLRVPRMSSNTVAGRPGRASISSPATTVSRSGTWSATAGATTATTARTTATATWRTSATTVAPRVTMMTRPSANAASAASATSWPRCSCPRACRCCRPVTNSGARSAATTTPTARTMT